LPGFEYYRVDVAFEVVYRDQWNPLGAGNGFSVGQAYEERTGQPGARCRGHRIEVAPRESGLLESFPDNRNDGP
jgi:hypothetical protein